MKPYPAAIVSSAFALAACSSGTNSSAECMGTTTTLTVSVIDDSNEPMSVCDAEVMVRGPGTHATFKPSGGPGDCIYVGNVDGAGTYTISATANGYQTPPPITQAVQNGCSASVNIDVTPN